jgi:general secretion pathway protein D
MKAYASTAKRSQRLALACLAASLSACEWLGPQVDSNPLVLPAAQAPVPAVQTQPLESGAHLESKNLISEPEVFSARSGRVGKAPAPAAPPAQGGFMLNFDEADLGEVAKVILGESLKKNYVINPKVAGKVTLRTVRPLTEKELLPTLEMVLRTNGAILVESKGGYRIEPDAEAARHGGLSRAGYRLQVIPLKYVSAQDTQTVLQPILPPNAIIKVDTARNLLFLAGSGDDLERVLEVVQVFDVNYLKGMSFGLYPLKNVSVTTIFGEMQAMFGENAGGPLAGTIRLLPIERLNAVMAITAQPAYLEELRTWVDRLDRSNSAGGGNMHVYRVQHVDAMQLAVTLNQVLNGGMGMSSLGSGVAPGMNATSISGGSSSSGLSGTSGSGLGSSSSSGSGSSTGSSTSSSTGSSSSSSGSSLNSSPLGGGSSSSLSSSGGLSSGSSGGMGGSAYGAGSSAGYGMGYGASGMGMGGMGLGMGGMGGGMGGMGPNATRVTPDIANNALVIMASPFEYQAIEKLLKELDVMPLQVLVDAMIVEVKLDDSLKYGLQWLFKHGSGQAALATSTGGTILDAAAAAASGGFGYSFIAKNIQVTLDALADAKKVNVLSSPSLMVLNNQQATIKVGDQVPIRTSETTNTSSLTQQGGTTSALVTGQIQMRDTGVLLTIRPRVNKGGLVTMDIQQAVDDVANTESSSIDSPTIQQRQIQSAVAVNSGDTIVLGGLIKENRDKGVTGLPWLSSLPGIGPLFGSHSRSISRTELVVLITPHVMDDRSSLISVTEEYKSRLKGLQQAQPSETD